MSRRAALGRQGERLAAGHLEANDYVIVTRNFRCRAGEIDLIARRAETLVFVEVKARRSPRYGPPEEALTRAKQAHLIAAANSYLQAQSLEGVPWRIDVIAIELDERGGVRALRHVENAVGPT